MSSASSGGSSEAAAAAAAPRRAPTVKLGLRSKSFAAGLVSAAARLHFYAPGIATVLSASSLAVQAVGLNEMQWAQSRTSISQSTLRKRANDLHPQDTLATETRRGRPLHRLRRSRSAGRFNYRPWNVPWEGGAGSSSGDEESPSAAVIRMAGGCHAYCHTRVCSLTTQLCCS